MNKPYHNCHLEESTFFTDGDKKWHIKLSDIIMITSNKDYVKVHLTNRKPIMALAVLKDLAEELKPYKLFRTNRSTIINKKHILYTKRFEIILNGIQNPVIIQKQYALSFFSDIGLK
jgi:DNA-binding LytR/AlgR family response regulator